MTIINGHFGFQPDTASSNQYCSNTLLPHFRYQWKDRPHTTRTIQKSVLRNMLHGSALDSLFVTGDQSFCKKSVVLTQVPRHLDTSQSFSFGHRISHALTCPCLLANAEIVCTFAKLYFGIRHVGRTPRRGGDVCSRPRLHLCEYRALAVPTSASSQITASASSHLTSTTATHSLLPRSCPLWASWM